MKSLILIGVSFLFSVNCFAQKRKIFKINPGEKVIETIPKEEMYSFTAFEDGTVLFKNNNFSKAKMNYNSLYGEMMFIDAKGDTLSITDETTIKLIAIKKDTFFVAAGYLQLVADFGSIKLARKQFFSFVNRQKLGPFGEPTSATVDTYNRASSSTYFKELVPKEILTLAKNTELYIGDRFNNFKAVNKKNLAEFFSDKQKELSSYLKENKTDFSNEEEIKTLIAQFVNK